jgi:tetratricopeptide (TPR) repeat protein
MDADRSRPTDGKEGAMINRAVLASLILALMLAGSSASAKPTAGYSSADLYNLGNSYARAGKPGMAVLNYERALLLSPNDADIEANLRYVRSTAKLSLESRSWFERWVRLGPTAFALIGVLGVSMIGTGLLAVKLYSRRWPGVLVTLVGLGLVGLPVSSGILIWPKLHEGVIITNGTQVRVSPVPMGDELFVLPEAETVKITAEHEDFVLIQTRAGRSGWVSRANLAPVVPRSDAKTGLLQ